MKEPEHFGETVSELKIFFFFYSELRIPMLYMSSVNILEKRRSCCNLLPHSKLITRYQRELRLAANFQNRSIENYNKSGNGIEHTCLLNYHLFDSLNIITY